MDIHVRRMAIKHIRYECHGALAGVRQRDSAWPISILSLVPSWREFPLRNIGAHWVAGDARVKETDFE